MEMEDPETIYRSVRRAAEVHRQVRAHAHKTIGPGMSMLEIADFIEDGTRALVEQDTSGMLQSGVGFPTGLSLNHCAAHYTSNAGDKTSQQVTASDWSLDWNGLNRALEMSSRKKRKQVGDRRLRGCHTKSYSPRIALEIGRAKWINRTEWERYVIQAFRKETREIDGVGTEVLVPVHRLLVDVLYRGNRTISLEQFWRRCEWPCRPHPTGTTHPKHF